MTYLKTMLFRRRKRLPFIDRATNFLWPHMGWRRTARYFKYRTVRIPDSAHRIAAGLAVGCAISWTPAFGTHIVQALFFAWIVRGNWLAAILGTAFGNPWTFPFLFWIAYQVGRQVFLLAGWGGFAELPGPLSFEELMNHPMKILLPMLAGGYLCALLSFPVFYYPFYYMTKGAQAARRARITRIVHANAAAMTGQDAAEGRQS